MFQNNLANTGFSLSTAPNSNEILWKSSGGGSSSPVISNFFGIHTAWLYGRRDTNAAVHASLCLCGRAPRARPQVDPFPIDRRDVNSSAHQPEPGQQGRDPKEHTQEASHHLAE